MLIFTSLQQSPSWIWWFGITFVLQNHCGSLLSSTDSKPDRQPKWALLGILSITVT